MTADINAKAAYFFIKEAGRTLNDNRKIITIVTSLLAAFTDGYSTYAGCKAPVAHSVLVIAGGFALLGAMLLVSARIAANRHTYLVAHQIISGR